MPLNPEKLKRFDRLTGEYLRRVARDQQSKRGWYDEDGVRQGGLIAFVRYFWSVLEPETAFVDGWPLWAMCLPYNAKVKTSAGDQEIGRIVESRWGGTVLSFNHRTGKPEWKQIAAHMKSPGQPLLKITTSAGTSIRLTYNHPIFTLENGYVRADQVQVGDSVCVELPTLRQSLLSKSLATKGRLLLNEMLRSSQDGCGKYHLSEMWGQEDLESRQGLSSMLVRRKEGDRPPVTMLLLRQIVSATAMANEPTPLSKIRQVLRGILQFAMFGKGDAWRKQSFLRQRKPREPLPARVLGDTVGDSGARGKPLLSLFGRAEEIGRASHRPRHHEQRTVESRGSVPQMPLSAARSSDEGIESVGCGSVGTAVVTAIVREAWIPDAVYNIEVIDNHNYFADGILAHNCEHLEAVTFGEINRLLINVPPGFCKSLLTECFWPAWEWGPMKKTHYRYVSFSYSASLTERDNDRFRTLIASDAYQRLYGPMRTSRVVQEEAFREVDEQGQVTLRNKTTIKVMNTRTGWKLASSVGGVATGERGDRIIIDDPHSVLEAESERVRSETVRWFRESISSRFNNLDTGALVIIMQRVHYDDVSGVALSPEFDYCHLCIPWEFDPSRAVGEHGELVENHIGWSDPRADADNPNANEGEAAWPDRFSDKAIARLRSEGGPYMWASQFQQSPVPRGENIFKREWWQLWDSPNGKYPTFDMVIGSFDGALTEKETSDYSAFTLWGIFHLPNDASNAGGWLDDRTGKIWQVEDPRQRRIMLIKAWQKRLPFSAPRMPMKGNESYQAWRQRTMNDWGVIEWLYDSCTWFNGREFRVDRLLIEAKANGLPAAREIQSRYGVHDIPIQLVEPKGDKIARALAVQPIFAGGLVYSPSYDWAEVVIEQAEKFPMDRHDDLVDTMTQALRYFRDVGMAQTEEEITFEERERVMHKPRRKRLYPC